MHSIPVETSFSALSFYPFSKVETEALKQKDEIKQLSEEIVKPFFVGTEESSHHGQRCFRLQDHDDDRTPPKIKTLIETVNKFFWARFNCVHVTHLKSTTDSIQNQSLNMISNDPKGCGIVLISCSLNSDRQRSLRIRFNTPSQRIAKEIVLDDSHFIQQAGSFQREFSHGVPPILQTEEQDDDFFLYTFHYHHHE